MLPPQGTVAVNSAVQAIDAVDAIAKLLNVKPTVAATSLEQADAVPASPVPAAAGT
jgi:hypothetical protein